MCRCLSYFQLYLQCMCLCVEEKMTLRQGPLAFSGEQARSELSYLDVEDSESPQDKTRPPLPVLLAGLLGSHRHRDPW